ncbi:MAG: arginine--tRNA ligase [Solobacterium sp.]|nr:arginine--tRNA ligase [Solobacterium sp.]
MSEIEEKLKAQIAKAVNQVLDASISSEEIELSLPKDKAHGDYATNIAMKYAKKVGKNPRDFANEIVAAFPLEEANVERLEVAGPGFINAFMKSDHLASVIGKVLRAKEDYGKSNVGNGKKINLEYVSANPTGDLHPGHARGAAIGDAVARLLTMAGYDVTREYYVNDAGNQINNMALSLQARYLQLCGVDAEIPEDGYHAEDLVHIAEAIKAEIGEQYKDTPKEESLPYFRQYGLKAELDKLKADLKEFRVEFDVWSSEQAIRDRGLVEKAVDTLKAQGNTYELDGALYLKTSQLGDEKDRVLIKSDGSYTYFTPDIAYHLDKLDRGFDQLVDFLGADHHGYIPRLKAGIAALGYPSEKLEVDIIQMARMIKDGEEFKLSKRSGKAVALRDLMEEAGVDALRYYFASRASDTQMDFDLDMAKKKSNENPVYYAQYAHARMTSVLEKANGIDMAEKYDLITTAKEMTLLKLMDEFEKVVADAAQSRMPHKMVNYITKFAQAFHSYYNDSKIIDSEKLELSSQRLALVKACEITMKNALESIGVNAPEHM